VASEMVRIQKMGEKKGYTSLSRGLQGEVCTGLHCARKPEKGHELMKNVTIVRGEEVLISCVDKECPE